jgi:hypothetical protein
MNLRGLVTSIVAVAILLQPLHVMAQSVATPVRDASGVIPHFYSMDGRVYWCIEEHKARRVAKESNDLLFCRREAEKLQERIAEKDGMISTQATIIADQNRAAEALVRVAQEHAEVRKQLADSEKVLRKDNDGLRVENKKLRDVARRRWYESPFLWFFVGAATTAGGVYLWQVQTGSDGDN